MKRFNRNEFPRDTTASIPGQAFHFSPAARTRLVENLNRSATERYSYLIADIETEDSQLLALALVHGTFQACSAVPQPRHATAPAIAEWLQTKRKTLAEIIAQLKDPLSPCDRAVLTSRAPISLVAGCWLDRVSQPATEPALLVSLLTAHRFAILGKGVVAAGQEASRIRVMEGAGVYLPDVRSSDFVTSCDSPTTVVQTAAFYLALSRWPASFLPEVLGVHYAHYCLAVDDQLLGSQPFLHQDLLDKLVMSVFDAAAQNANGIQEIDRFLLGVYTCVQLEERSLNVLLHQMRSKQALSLTQQVGSIIKRHIGYAGRQHAYVRMGDRSLLDWFSSYSDEEIDAFMAVFRRSKSIKRNARGSCPFIEATKFGGSMFGLFTEREYRVLAAWTQEVQDGAPSEAEHTIGGDLNCAWDVAWPTEFNLPENVIWRDSETLDDRVLLHRLINIESYANTLVLIRSRIEHNLRDAEVMFEHGKGGRFTDASWLPWDKHRLEQRAEEIYWTKLIDPWERLDTVPDRDTVIFGQKLAALGSLLDGCWAHRAGSVGRYRSCADGLLYAIYADELGNGEIEKNHIVLIQRVLRSMGITLPHIRDEAFIDQSELPDLYDFPLHQIGLSLFPDSFYPEILGYNLGIEMLGLGEMRLQEIQKLRRHGFETIYEEAHLTIDNFSSGHARQSLILIESFMDDMARYASQDEVASIWRRVWRGYASFAWFIETDIKKAIAASSRSATAELTI